MIFLALSVFIDRPGATALAKTPPALFVARMPQV
jgi:hypothetical protein